jgi:putative polyhydroxyalkanoate system protein
MSDINFVRPHSLPIAKARTLVQKVADGLATEYSLSSEWDGNTLRFHRAGVDGELEVTASEIRLNVTLGILLKSLKGTLVGYIERHFDEALVAKPKVAEKKPAKKTTRKG